MLLHGPDLTDPELPDPQSPAAVSSAAAAAAAARVKSSRVAWLLVRPPAETVPVTATEEGEAAEGPPGALPDSLGGWPRADLSPEALHQLAVIRGY